MKAMLCAQDIAVSLGGRRVLHGLSAGFAAGRWTAVVGPNGAGKSTLLQALADLLPLDHGQVALGGRPLQDWSRRGGACRIAWLGQQETAPSMALRVRDLVMLGRLPHQRWLALPSPADEAAVDAAMAATGCLAWRDRLAGGLSGGERQRVLLARLLATGADVLLMDEPLAHLDPPHQADWVRMARTLVSGGRLVVSVLHELNVALQADELLVVGAGRARHQGAVADAATRQALCDVFGQRIGIHPLNGQWVALPEER